MICMSRRSLLCFFFNFLVVFPCGIFKPLAWLFQTGITVVLFNAFLPTNLSALAGPSAYFFYFFSSTLFKYMPFLEDCSFVLFWWDSSWQFLILSIKISLNSLISILNLPPQKKSLKI